MPRRACPPPRRPCPPLPALLLPLHRWHRQEREGQWREQEVEVCSEVRGGSGSGVAGEAAMWGGRWWQ